MDKKHIIIIGGIVTAIGGLGYMLFSGQSTENNEASQSFNGRNSQNKSSRTQNKQTTLASTLSDSPKSTHNAGIYSSGDSSINENQSEKNSSLYSGQSNAQLGQSNPAYRSYFSNYPVLSSKQMMQKNDGTYSSYNTSQNLGGSAAAGSLSSSANFTANTKRLQECTQTLQPILDKNTTDSTIIRNTLINIMGFSMLDTNTQSTYVSNIAIQKYGKSATNYCSQVIQKTDASSMEVANFHNNCINLVQDFYKTNGTGASEDQVINAFAQLNILNGATTIEQKKQILQNYFGANYTYIITTMKSLNANDIGNQATQICSKSTSSVVNGINSTSQYLDCINNINTSKDKKITDVSKAIKGFAVISQVNQEKLTSYYALFLSGSKPASEICTFLVESTPIDIPKTNDKILTNQNTIEGCTVLIPIMQSEYNAYIVSPYGDPIANIINRIQAYQFFVTETYKTNVTKYLIIDKITDPNFTSLSSKQQFQISQRLYNTSLSLNESGNNTSAFAKELYSNLCKCTHIDFDDIAWASTVKSYLSFKKGAYSIPLNTIQRQAMISSSPFYQSCYNESNPKSSLILLNLTGNTTTIPTITQAVKSINNSYAQIPQLEDKIANLTCYSQYCINNTCPISCLNKIESVCEALTVEYLKINPQNTDASSIFSCPVNSINDKPICYSLTNTQRDAIGDALNKTITKFQLDAISVRKKIIEDLWNIHKQKQEKTNTSISVTDCTQSADAAWGAYFKPYIQGQ